MSVRAPARSVNFATARCCIGRGLAAIRALGQIDRAFLFYMLLSKQPEIAGREGAVFASISKSEIEEIAISLPPVAEQRRIVAILDEAFERLALAAANAQKNLKNARELFDIGVGVKLFGDPIAKGWRRTSVEHLASRDRGAIRTGPFGSQLLHSEFVEDGIAVLEIDNAVANEFLWGKRRFITKEKYTDLVRYTVKPGDVLITIMGTCGRYAVVPNDIPTAINSKHLCCITLDRTKCLPDFLHAYFLYHPESREF